MRKFRKQTALFCAGMIGVFLLAGCGGSGREMARWLERLSGKQLFFAPGPVIGQIEPFVKAALFALHPILHLNETEAKEASGELEAEKAARNLYRRTGNLVIITLGAEGALYDDGNGVHRIPSRAAEVVDTIGAGDSHLGAVIGGLSRGYSIESAIRFANCVAAEIVSIQGPVMEKQQFEQRMGKWNEQDKSIF